jgi:lysozyme
MTSDLRFNQLLRALAGTPTPPRKPLVETPEIDLIGLEAPQITQDEGKRNVSYLDTEGLLTGGVGHLMSKEEQKKYPLGTQIPEEVVQEWLRSDLSVAKGTLGKLDLPEDTPEEVQKVLLNMSFNLGEPRLKKFKGTLKAIRDKDFDRAADEMVDSRWYKQTKGRAKRLVDRMRALGNKGNS